MKASHGLTKVWALLTSVALAGAAGVVLVQRGGPAEPVAVDEVGQTAFPQSTGSRIESSPSISATYETDVFTNEGFRELDRAARAQGKIFIGRVNGILVDPKYDGPCYEYPVEMTRRQVRRHVPPAPRWLPPGTTPRGTNGWLCGEEPLQAGRVFDVNAEQGIEFGIHRRFGQSALSARAGERRVKKGRVQGRPAVFIHPVTDGGAGNSWIAFMDGEDLIELIAADLRFEDLRRVAESLPLKGS